jgi:hypothetical protein
MTNTLPDLEVTCPFCKGQKTFRDEFTEDNDGIVNCHRCNGSGFVPTDLGKQILSLVQHKARLAVMPELMFFSAA